jgi:ABC-2 type transport system ATP-binding protein
VVTPLAISALGLGKAFQHRAVLHQLNFSVEPGMAVGLLGANGAGKTTLMKLLLGLLKADVGRASLFGENSFGLTPQVRQRIAYVAQSSNQFWWLSGRAMLKYIAAFYPNFDWSYADELLDRWKVSTKSVIGVLSPGQQQRLSIIRALATRPDLIMLDEPIASLDPATRMAVIDELISERRRRTLTILFSSHITGDLERLCSHLAIMMNGQIDCFEPLSTFSDLVRVQLSGDESFLSKLTLAGCHAMRTPTEGRRLLLIDRNAAKGLAERIPPQVSVEVQPLDLEAVLAEWMQ